jgi:hypothetical protein
VDEALLVRGNKSEARELKKLQADSIELKKGLEMRLAEDRPKLESLLSLQAKPHPPASDGQPSLASGSAPH